jgi:hypothetical protein
MDLNHLWLCIESKKCPLFFFFLKKICKEKKEVEKLKKGEYWLNNNVVGKNL